MSHKESMKERRPMIDAKNRSEIGEKQKLKYSEWQKKIQTSWERKANKMFIQLNKEKKKIERRETWYEQERISHTDQVGQMIFILSAIGSELCIFRREV